MSAFENLMRGATENVNATGLHVLKHHLRRTEQVGIDGVKVVVVPGEDRREAAHRGRVTKRRERCGRPPRADRRPPSHRARRTCTVENRIVRATDRGQVVRGDRRQRGEAMG